MWYGDQYATELGIPVHREEGEQCVWYWEGGVVVCQCGATPHGGWVSFVVWGGGRPWFWPQGSINGPSFEHR